MRAAVAVLLGILLTGGLAACAAGGGAAGHDTAKTAWTATASPAKATLRPLHWGDTARGYATVCLERWYAVRLKKLRNASVDAGEGAMAQIGKEKQALFEGKAWCFTGRVTFTVADHADVIDGVRTWVQVPDAEGPTDCPEAIGPGHCRWTIRTLRFVEAKVEHAGVPAGTVAYVSTPRPIVAARASAKP